MLCHPKIILFIFGTFFYFNFMATAKGDAFLAGIIFPPIGALAGLLQFLS